MITSIEQAFDAIDATLGVEEAIAKLNRTLLNDTGSGAQAPGIAEVFDALAAVPGSIEAKHVMRGADMQKAEQDNSAAD